MEISTDSQPKSDILSSIADGLDVGGFPSLKVVLLCNWYNDWHVDRQRLRSMGVNVHFITRERVY